jgi:hypothetical protein
MLSWGDSVPGRPGGSSLPSRARLWGQFKQYFTILRFAELLNSAETKASRELFCLIFTYYMLGVEKRFHFCLKFAGYFHAEFMSASKRSGWQKIETIICEQHLL